jgi:hypothetical protein
LCAQDGIGVSAGAGVFERRVRRRRRWELRHSDRASSRWEEEQVDHSRVPVLEALEAFRRNGDVPFSAPGHRQGRGVDPGF